VKDGAWPPPTEVMTASHKLNAKQKGGDSESRNQKRAAKAKGPRKENKEKTGGVFWGVKKCTKISLTTGKPKTSEAGPGVCQWKWKGQ